jgi:hypothetical protein
VCLSTPDRRRGEVVHWSGCPNVMVDFHGYSNETCYCGTVGCQDVVQRCYRNAVVKFQTDFFGACSLY